MSGNTIYLDHAATSFPKPKVVLEAVAHWFADLGVSADRGDSDRCSEVAAVVERTRAALAARSGVPPPRVAFTSGATESLNLFLRGYLNRGDTVVTTAIEHSSVVRPLTALQAERDLQIEIVPADADGYVNADAVDAVLRRESAKLLVFSHAGNVTGAVLDAAGMCERARQRGITTLLDASQTAGLLPLDIGADAVAASAHKSLLGPPGLGFLAVAEHVDLRPSKQGGTGSAHALAHHPEEWPLAMQAGTPNTPAIFGLDAALRWLAERDEDLLGHGLELIDALRTGLRRNADITVHSPEDGPRLPILSFTHADLDTAEIGAILAGADIHVRTGFHCAPWIHAALGTESAGTVRVSPGPFSTADDIRALIAVLESV